jgi:hypothetical protein
MSVIGSNILAGASGQGGGYTIEESLRFNASQSSYLSRTPASAGNRTTWTYSAWVKRGKLGAQQYLLQARISDGGNNTDKLSFFFNTNDALYVFSQVTAFRITTAVFRDPSAWYHIVLVGDTSNATPNNRLRLYVNNVEQTYSTLNNPTVNLTTAVNAVASHQIGAESGPATFFDGYITEVNLIDGQALTPSDFGDYNAETGVWQPVAYAGTYGTNGFYLPMQLDNTVEGFNTVTYIGNNSTHKIGGVGFSPDLVWIKSRATANHNLYDSVRGAGNMLLTNGTNAEFTGGELTGFTSDGFTLGPYFYQANYLGEAYTAWCWDAGDTTVSNTDGSITSSVRANPAYGFSVVTFTGDANGSSTVGHGLGTAPSMVIVKRRDVADGWPLYHSSLGVSKLLELHSTSGEQTSSNYWGSAITSTTFGLSAGGSNNRSGSSNVAYCFSEIAGYSKFGSYTGNGSATGPTVTLGFKPAMVLIKRTDTGGNNWGIYDNTRSTNINDVDAELMPSSSAAESTIYSSFAFTDTGFQPTSTQAGTNASGGTFIYMAFKDTREYAYWLDDSGNNNDWQPNGGITTESTVTDTPTPYADGGNYATWNPIDIPNLSATSYSRIFSEANLTVAKNGSEGVVNMTTVASFEIPTSGKWYWEIAATTVASAAASRTQIGIMNQAAKFADGSDHVYADVAGVYAYAGNGQKAASPGTFATYGASFTSGVVIGVAVDADNGTIAFYKNGAAQGTAYSGLDMSTGFSPSVGYWGTFTANFGQRPFAYTPPTGFLPLHTGNLPDSAIVDGSQYFAIDTYSGTGATNARTIGFQPDFVWLKSRTNAYWHKLFDSIRGANKPLVSNSTTAELTETTGLMSFDSDGFTLGTSADSTVNNSGVGQTYVAWNWKANGAGVSNTDGSITSTVSANPTAGFSVVTYTGTGANATVGHGLGVAPKFIIIKGRNTPYNWAAWHGSFTGLQRIFPNTTGAVASSASYWNSAIPTSTIFSLGSEATANDNSGTFVAYCFAEVEGYSKFGSYTGNGSADGPFVYLGFRPAFVMVKRFNSTGNWFIWDSSRDTYNTVLREIYPDSSSAEYTRTGSSDSLDFTSNGFKLRFSATYADRNASGGNYIYMAFAENPFKNSLAR